MESGDNLDIYVIQPPEPSAGLRQQTYTISGGVYVDSKEDREEIRDAISSAFDIITGGGHHVIFSDEIPYE